MRWRPPTTEQLELLDRWLKGGIETAAVQRAWPLFALLFRRAFNQTTKFARDELLYCRDCQRLGYCGLRCRLHFARP